MTYICITRERHINDNKQNETIMNNANNTNSQAVTFTLEAVCMGNFCIKGATHTAHVSGYRKHFGDNELTKQFEAIRTAGKGIIEVTLAQYKRIAKFAFATKKND